jgi:hypothetical protein
MRIRNFLRYSPGLRKNNDDYDTISIAVLFVKNYCVNRRELARGVNKYARKFIED